MKKQIRAIAAVAAATMLLTGCAAHQQNNTSEQTPTTQTQSSTASSVSTETTPARENWSLLDHLPEWSDGTVTPAVTADPSSSIPFGENPFNDDDWTKNLSLDGAPNFNGVNVSLEELKALPISGYMALNREDEGYSIKGTSDEYDTAEEIDRNIQDYCVTGEEGNYYQIGSYATDGSYAMMLNEDIAKEENMTFGDAFDKGLYYSRINIYDFDWFPAYDSTAQEKFEALYEHFGNPSGLYWKTTTFGGMAFNSFDELKAATYEDVGEAKSYWLVWDCDGYTLAAECYDQFDGKETSQETSVTSIYVFPDADESYISYIDASSIVDGYVKSYYEASRQTQPPGSPFVSYKPAFVIDNKNIALWHAKNDNPPMRVRHILEYVENGEMVGKDVLEYDASTDKWHRVESECISLS